MPGGVGLSVGEDGEDGEDCEPLSVGVGLALGVPDALGLGLAATVITGLAARADDS